MNPAQTLLIEQACLRLVTQYCHWIDHGEAARVAELFSDDATWTAGSTTMQGRDQLLSGFKRRQEQSGRRSRHVCHNFLCNVLDENRAEGVVYLTLYRHDGEPGSEVSPLEGPILVGEYRDCFVRTPEGWRIAERTLATSFLRGAA